ncbi:MAG: methyltransferase domain-containing protein [Frankia sp.]|nr:methyltransferase domain-containing protein [Frankia sp.]
MGTPGSTTPPREAITVERPAAAPPGQAEQQRLRPARPAVGYALHGGEADAHRLATQARALEATTAEFLTAAGLRPGWRCLDVGCGHGQVSLLLATRVRPGGRVVGIDGDAASLRVARRSAADAGAAVTFLRADAGSLPARRGRFDLAYTRLLLSHLVDPLEALRAMTTAVRPGGVVAVEDVHIDWLGLIRALPALWGGGAGGRADPVLLEFAELIDTVIRSRGGDPAIGPRLPALLTAAGLTDITAAVRPLPIPADPSGTIVAAMVDAIRDTAISAGLTDAARLDRMRTALRQLPAEYTEVSRRIARLYQVSGRRPRPRGTPAYGDEPAAWPAEPGQPTWPADAWSASAA